MRSYFKGLHHRLVERLAQNKGIGRENDFTQILQMYIYYFVIRQIAFASSRTTRSFKFHPTIRGKI